MPQIFGGEPLSLKYMTQVAIAVCTEDFYSHAVGIPLFSDRTFNFIVKAWPATMGVKLVLGAVQRGFTLPADITTSFEEVIVFADKGPFGTFFDDHAMLFRR